jgi:WD40 repeat protein
MLVGNDYLPMISSLALVLSVLPIAWVDDPPTYERDVRPILARRCTVCHNARDVGDADISAGLALDTYDSVSKGSPKAKVVLPGNAAGSPLYDRLIATDAEKRMPLFEDPLPEPQRAVIRRWIEAGAPRGEPISAASSQPILKSSRKVLRTLDVAILVAANVPKGTHGLDAGGSVELLLKVGPLPSVSALALGPDGRVLAVGTSGRVVLWDLVDGCAIGSIRDVPGPVHALAYSRDGRRLAVGSGLPARSGSVRIYTVPDGTLAQVFEGHKDVVYALAFRGDGRQLVSAGFDATVRLWDLATGKPAGEYKGHSDFVYEVAFAPDGRSILSASKDRSVRRFDASTIKGLVTYSDHDDDVLALAICPDGKQFVSAGNEPQLRWWPIDGEKPAKKIGGHSGPVHQLAFSANGKRLISASGDGTVRVWDGSTGIFQRTLPGTTEWQYAVALSGDGRLAAGGGWDGLVRIWDADKGALLGTLLQPPGLAAETTEWLAVAPAGYCSGSNNMVSLIRWKVGGIETSHVATELLRPDKLAQSLRGELVPPAFSAAKESSK